MKDEKDTKKELKELYSKMIQEHPELETMRVKTVLYSLGIMLIVVLGLFAYPKYGTSNSMVLGGILSQFVLAFFLSYLLEKGVPYIDHFRKINHQFKGMKIGMPKIGCGLAGGDWNLVTKMIQEEMADCKVTIMML